VHAVLAFPVPPGQRPTAGQPSTPRPPFAPAQEPSA
jgi:hypothetical protein